MLVKKWMSSDVITINSDDSVLRATSLMKKHNIKGLPVMENGRLVGVVTDRDLKRASASDARSLEIYELLYLIEKIKIKDIMTKDPITVPFNYTVEEAAEVLLKKKISGLPVVDNEGKLVGVITKTDIFRILVSLTGVKNRGVLFAFRLEDRAGSIKEVTDIIRNYDCRMVSILSTYDSSWEGYRLVYVRACGCDRERLKQLTEELKLRAPMMYVVDHREGKKDIYQDDVEKLQADTWDQWSQFIVED